MREQEFWLLH